MSAELTAVEVAAWWHEQRAAQGLPDKITDPAILARVITLATEGRDDDGPSG